jgi:8-oxo-dGTP pyrophosphatase MutT (NUDIX family)
MSEPAFTDITVIPAATVVVFRRAADGGMPELLMLRRAKEMRFAGGAAVFPGGRIDDADRDLAHELGVAETVDQAAARIAGVRETLEEAGLVIGVTQQVSADEALAARALLLEAGRLEPVLERHSWNLDLARLVPFARWCPRWEGAFDTRFFLTDLGTGAVDVTVDATENTELFWASAARALEMANAGEISVIFPTRRNLERLAQFASFAEARAHAETIPIRTITPRREERDGETHLVIPEGHGYPVTSQPLAAVQRG